MPVPVTSFRTLASAALCVLGAVSALPCAATGAQPDSTIVLLSDHVMMNSQALQTLDTKRAPRLNHMVIWDKGQEPGVVHRRASQFDVAPTVLQVLLGKSYQVGFGFSMLDSRPNLTEQYGREVFDESVYAWRTESWKKW